MSSKEALMRNKLDELKGLTETYMEAVAELVAPAETELGGGGREAGPGESAGVPVEEEGEAFDEAVLEGGLRYLDALNERLDTLNADLTAHLRSRRAHPAPTPEADSRVAAGT